MKVITAAATVPRVFSITARHMRMAEAEISLRPADKVAILRARKPKWASEILDLVGIERHVIGSLPEFPSPCIFVGNHVGFLDIPFLMSIAPVCFVAKQELRKWLVVGRGCELTETILVDRASSDSRRRVGEQIAAALKSGSKQLCVFPSGTTCLDEKKPWMPGAFRIAESNNIPIVPFRIRYHPLRPAAYIDRDNFLVQLWRIHRRRPIQAEIEFHPPVIVTDPRTEAQRWQTWTQEFLGKSS
jgi:1-acyl-sn-glycerol-3-phosphate acyltransferase